MTNTTDIRVERNDKESGRVIVRYLPPSLANNTEYMRRHGFRLAQVEKFIPAPTPEPKVEANIEVKVEPKAEKFVIDETIPMPEAPEPKIKIKKTK